PRRGGRPAVIRRRAGEEADLAQEDTVAAPFRGLDGRRQTLARRRDGRDLRAAAALVGVEIGVNLGDGVLQGVFDGPAGTVGVQPAVGVGMLNAVGVIGR